MPACGHPMKRRHFLSLLGIGVALPLKNAMARPTSPDVTLLNAELELGGEWGGSAPADAAAVIERMRKACLADVALLSDRQPQRLRVDDKSGSNPSIWLHTDKPTTAWINVIVGTRDWCNLAYQFGHEFGHVFCNSWQRDAKPRNPCQWIEEALAEAFSLRGLRLLADDWMRAPPFPNDAKYANSIRKYREALVTGYRKTAQEQRVPAGFSAWFKSQKPFLDEHGGLDSARGAVLTMLDLLEGDPAMVADLGALNRWPERSGVPLHDYLNFWEKSCTDLNAPGLLPARLGELFADP